MLLFFKEVNLLRKVVSQTHKNYCQKWKEKQKGAL